MKAVVRNKLIVIIIGCFVHVNVSEIFKIPLKRANGLVRKSVVSPDNRIPVVEEGKDLDLNGKPGQGYYTEVEIGTPAQKMNVLVDTGSSNFAVAAAKNKDITKYFKTDASRTYDDLRKEVSVPYTQGNWKGNLGADIIHIPGLQTANNIIGKVAFITSSKNFFINGSNWQGIFGLAYKDIARPDSTVEPFFDNLVSEAGITNEFSMQLCGTVDTPNNTDVSMGGVLVMGGVDPAHYKGDFYYTPIRKEWYYEVIVTDIGIDNTSLGLNCVEYNTDKTIVDSGTTNLRLPASVFNKTVKEIKSRTILSDGPPPAEFWTGKRILCWSEGSTPYDNFPSIYISLAEYGNINSSIKLSISSQQYLRAVGDEVDISSDQDCFKFAIASSNTGTVIGAVIMEGYYVHFDRTNKRIGFAHTTCEVRDPTLRSTVAGGIAFSSGNVTVCGYVKPAEPLSTLQIVAYVMAGVCVICLVPLVFMVAHWIYKKKPGKMCNHDHGHDQDVTLMGSEDGRRHDDN